MQNSFFSYHPLILGCTEKRRLSQVHDDALIFQANKITFNDCLVYSPQTKNDDDMCDLFFSRRQHAVLSEGRNLLRILKISLNIILIFYNYLKTSKLISR